MKRISFAIWASSTYFQVSIRLPILESQINWAYDFIKAGKKQGISLPMSGSVRKYRVIFSQNIYSD